jgi:hypothetical protein
VVITAEPGHSYYLKVGVVQRFADADMICQEITKAEADYRLQRTEPQPAEK